MKLFFSSLSLITMITILFQGNANCDLLKAIQERHAVRQYLPTPIPNETVASLTDIIRDINDKSGLNIQLITNDSTALSSFLVTYGRFKEAKNYFALVGPNDEKLLENIGYYGELIVLYCQSIGLNTCWVGGTYKKNVNRVIVNDGEKFVAIIAVGYGKDQGTPHISKPIEILADGLDDAPKWYIDGVKAAMLGPSALNKQNFHFQYKNGKVSILGTSGTYSKIDVGIAKLHFEIGSGKTSEIWQVPL